MDVEFGNAGDVDTNGTGWLVGFSPWARSGTPGGPDLRYMDRHALSQTLCIKWMSHPSPDPNGGDKPISTGRTISFLASATGRFRIRFSPDPGYPTGGVREFTLQRHGDYVIWGAGLFHSWTVESPCTIVTVRWVPVRPVGEPTDS